MRKSDDGAPQLSQAPFIWRLMDHLTISTYCSAHVWQESDLLFTVTALDFIHAD